MVLIFCVCEKVVKSGEDKIKVLKRGDICKGEVRYLRKGRTNLFQNCKKSSPNSQLELHDSEGQTAT